MLFCRSLHQQLGLHVFDCGWSGGFVFSLSTLHDLLFLMNILPSFNGRFLNSAVNVTHSYDVSSPSPIVTDLSSVHVSEPVYTLLVDGSFSVSNSVSPVIHHSCVAEISFLLQLLVRD